MTMRIYNVTNCYEYEDFKTAQQMYNDAKARFGKWSHEAEEIYWDLLVPAENALNNMCKKSSLQKQNL